MSDLKDLVPPLKLCQQIPAGEFEDSYAWYVWSYIDQKYLLCDGGKPDARLFRAPCPCGKKYFYPAPTLEEILYNMPPFCRFRLMEWRNEKNIAEKILKFWMELRGIEA